MKTFNIADLLELTAEAVPDRLALVAGEARLSYARLDERSTRFANALADAGISPDEHVAILSRNRAEWLEAMLGCFKARAVPINVNYRYTSDEIAYVLANARAAAVVAEAELMPALRVPRAGLVRTCFVIGDPVAGAAHYEAALAAASPTRRASGRSGDDRYVLYTGGTTGQPKGVVWRVEDLFFAALRGGNLTGEPISEPSQIIDGLPDRAEPWLVTSPLMHGNGQWNSLLPLLTGRGVVLWTGHRFDGRAIARLIDQELPRLLVLVGDAMALPFLDAIEQGGYDLGSIRVIASGGAMLSPVAKARLRARLPRVTVVDGFGASETGSSGTMVGTGPGALPRLRVGDDVAVLDDELQPVAPGAVGRLARKGHVPLGYWNDPVKTAATFPTDANGTRWAIPGDLAQLEDDGTVTLLGRGSSCINTGGEKVHPDEVAHAIKTHPDVTDALVVGIPDERFGQAVAALVAVSSRPGPDDEAIRNHVRTILAGYKVPRRIVRVDAIQYTAQGKADLRWAAGAAAQLPLAATDANALEQLAAESQVTS